MAIIVMICFGRSGGTVLNQCLGSLPKVIMLSEVNPLGGGSGKKSISLRTVKEQAKYWYDIDISADGFAEGILELQKISANTGNRLVVRDWSFVNFVPNPSNEFDPPRKFLTLEALQGKFEVIPFAFVRDAIDVWISYGSTKLIYHKAMKEFFDCYLDYIREILGRGIRIFKYEDFCRNPAEVIQRICEHTGLDYSDSFWNYESFEKVNGDVQIRGGSRGIRQKKIKPLPRKVIRKGMISRLNRCHKMIESNRLLGYPTSYYDVPRESRLTSLLSVCRKILIAFLKRSQRCIQEK